MNKPNRFLVLYRVLATGATVTVALLACWSENDEPTPPAPPEAGSPDASRDADVDDASSDDVSSLDVAVAEDSSSDGGETEADAMPNGCARDVAACSNCSCGGIAGQVIDLDAGCRRDPPEMAICYSSSDCSVVLGSDCAAVTTDGSVAYYWLPAIPRGVAVDPCPSGVFDQAKNMPSCSAEAGSPDGGAN